MYITLFMVTECRTDSTSNSTLSDILVTFILSADNTELKDTRIRKSHLNKECLQLNVQQRLLSLLGKMGLINVWAKIFIYGKLLLHLWHNISVWEQEFWKFSLLSCPFLDIYSACGLESVKKCLELELNRFLETNTEFTCKNS